MEFHSIEKVLLTKEKEKGGGLLQIKGFRLFILGTVIFKDCEYPIPLSHSEFACFLKSALPLKSGCWAFVDIFNHKEYSFRYSVNNSFKTSSLTLRNQ